MILKNISEGKNIVIAPTDGKKTIAQAKNVFDYIDSDFSNWDTDVTGEKKEETPVSVHEMAEDANFSQMFNSISSDLKKLCLTQDQIISFVENHKNWLHPEGYANFFLFEANNEFFVARVFLNSDGELDVGVIRFEDSRVWRAGSRYRVVVPQLEA